MGLQIYLELKCELLKDFEQKSNMTDTFELLHIHNITYQIIMEKLINIELKAKY